MKADLPQGGKSESAAPLETARLQSLLQMTESVSRAQSLAEIWEEAHFGDAFVHEGLRRSSTREQARSSIERQVRKLSRLPRRTPGHGRLRAARRLRQDPRLASLSLVALSGYGPTDDRPLLRNLEACLVKPVDLGALQDVLSSSRPARA